MPAPDDAALPPVHAASAKYRLEIWHNVLWARYKGRVFSAVQRLAGSRGFDLHVVQMAETEQRRKSLSAADTAYHQYPYELLYRGSIDDVPVSRSVPQFFWRGLTSRADMTIIAGYAAPQDWAQLAGLVLARRRRAVFCDSTAFDRPFSRAKHLAKRLFFSRCHIVFCYGERSRDFIASHGVPYRRIAIRRQAAALPDGYDPSAAAAARLGKHDIERARFIYVGRLSAEKNLIRLIDAFRRLHGDRRDATLCFLGDGPERRALEQAAADLMATGAVVFTGGVGPDALAAAYGEATALVLPSLSEPWGLVVNEALAYGCPALVSERCGCVPELVIEGRTGAAFDPFSIEAIEKAMRKSLDPAWHSADAVRARIDFVGQFSPNNTASQILDAVERCLAGKAPAG